MSKIIYVNNDEVSDSSTSKCELCGAAAACHIKTYIKPNYIESYTFVTRHFCSSCSQQGMHNIQEENKKRGNYGEDFLNYLYD